MKLKKGLIHVYTGDGKGKTTAALGQAVRSAGNGLNVYILQFLKGSKTGEIEVFNRIDNITFKRANKLKKFFFQMSDEEKREAARQSIAALQETKQLMKENRFDLVIFDEILGALENSMLPVDIVMDVLETKPPNVEVILTGRKCPESIVELADYVSEIKKVKHPYDVGIKARKGIEY